MTLNGSTCLIGKGSPDDTKICWTENYWTAFNSDFLARKRPLVLFQLQGYFYEVCRIINVQDVSPLSALHWCKTYQTLWFWYWLGIWHVWYKIVLQKWQTAKIRCIVKVALYHGWIDNFEMSNLSISCGILGEGMI